MLPVALVMVVLITIVALGLARSSSSAAEGRRFAIGLSLGVIATAVFLGPITDGLGANTDQLTRLLFGIAVVVVCGIYLLLERARSV